MSYLSGLNVITDHRMVERKQVRFPRTKKRRIRRKWAKRPENYKEFPLKTVYQVGNDLIMHPAMFAELQKQAEFKSAQATDPFDRSPGPWAFVNGARSTDVSLPAVMALFETSQARLRDNLVDWQNRVINDIIDRSFRSCSIPWGATF